MDEYTDYSCSTSLERLARDVETILRRWHVNDSDRHVSLARSRRGRTSFGGDSDDNAQSLSLSQSPPPGPAEPSSGLGIRDSCKSSLSTLRSEALTWEIGFHSKQHRVSHTVRLLLQLWEQEDDPGEDDYNAGPAGDSAATKPLSPATDPLSSSPLNQQHERLRLPHSLVRSKVRGSFGLADFSEMFGIGQHLTLTPIDSRLAALPENLLNHLLGWIRCEEGAASQQRAGGAGDRDAALHERSSTAHVVRSVLTSWLQSALNVAASASKCAIPVFGLWTSAYPAAATGQGPASSASGLADAGLRYSTRHPAWMMTEQLGDDMECIRRLWEANRRRGRRTKARNNTARRAFWPPAVSGAMFSPETGTSASFAVQWLPRPRGGARHFFWTWGDLLRERGPCDRAAFVAARHVYEWRTDPSSYSQAGGWATSAAAALASSSSSESEGLSSNRWRPPLASDSPSLDSVLLVLEHAAGCNDHDNPLWGPPVAMDPIESITSEFVWRSKGGALVQFPLKIRSRNFDQSDMMELQMSLAETLLNPTQGDVQVRTTYPSSIPSTSMAATLRCSAAVLIRAATLPPETLVSHLIDPELVLTWDNSAGNAVAADLAERAGVAPATLALVAAMDWETTASEVISEEEAQRIVQESVGIDLEQFPSLHFQHATPPGRLASILFAHMTAQRSLCSMAVVWCAFCQELREQWERRRSLLNLHDDVLPTATTAPETMGAKSTNAGQLHSVEPNPDLSDVMIQQKLQVFNVCVECQNGLERKELRALQQLVLQRQEDDSQTNGDEFYDSNEVEERVLPVAPKNHRSQSGPHDGTSPQRQGARCPVQGATLQREHTQLYAPYLQRPMPLTSDVAAERSVMMERQKHAYVGVRLEIARRIQEPKLHSDMQAFKAANPGSTLQDFLSWYGNPKNPMEEYLNADGLAAATDASTQGDDADDSSVRSRSSFRIRSLSFTSSPSQQETRQRLDKAAEAIRALEDTREFWLRTWSKADAVPAGDQPPLFDAANTVERVFDYMETLHPASLLCQVMATNLCTSFFVLTVSSREAAKLEIVRNSLGYLRSRVEQALKLLSDNVVSALVRDEELDEDISASVLKVSTIVACERACSAFAETEVLLSRAVSLLNKYPGRYKLVERMLRSAAIDVEDPSDRSIILDLVESQQRAFVPPGECPEASVRDYLLQSVDSPLPCQLLVRCCSERDADGTVHGSLALAIARTSRA